MKISKNEIWNMQTVRFAIPCCFVVAEDYEYYAWYADNFLHDLESSKST